MECWADSAWLCLFHFAQCTTQGIKAPSENKVMGFAHWSLVSPYCSFFLFFLFGLIPWSAGALWVHFSARASKTHSRRCPRWGIFRYSRGRLWPMWTVQVPCWGFIGFLSKLKNISLFLSFIFLTAKFFPFLFLYLSQSPTPSPWG